MLRKILQEHAPNRLTVELDGWEALGFLIQKLSRNFAVIFGKKPINKGFDEGLKLNRYYVLRNAVDEFWPEEVASV